MKSGGLNIRNSLHWYGILRPAPPLHFHLLQFTAFFYLIYRLASRNYATYGYLPDFAFIYPDRYVMHTWVFLDTPLSHWLNFHFIYNLIGYPNHNILYCVQIGCLLIATLGLIGVYPKLFAILCFMIKFHLTGFVQATNAEIDGGTLAIVALLVVAISPSKCFYRLGCKRMKRRYRSTDYHWPIFILWSLVAAFYGMAGLNKILAAGLHWPMQFKMENLVFTGLERSLFNAHRLVVPEFSSLLGSSNLSILLGVLTLLFELGFLAIHFSSSWRRFCILSAILLHSSVYMLAGINFLGSSLVLLLCFDWNCLERKGTVTVGKNSKIRLLIMRFDWFHRILLDETQKDTTSTQSHSLNEERRVEFKDENFRVYRNVDAVEQIFHRCPALYPLALLLKIPFAKNLCQLAMN